MEEQPEEHGGAHLQPPAPLLAFLPPCPPHSPYSPHLDVLLRGLAGDNTLDADVHERKVLGHFFWVDPSHRDELHAEDKQAIEQQAEEAALYLVQRGGGGAGAEQRERFGHEAKVQGAGKDHWHHALRGVRLGWC
eukprot:363333-Chlamydomonas_euryale.AAC.2